MNLILSLSAFSLFAFGGLLGVLALAGYAW